MSKASKRKPISMKRAKQWNPEVENLFRFQSAGFANIDEYLDFHDEGEEENVQVEIWPENGFVKCLKTRKECFVYFRRSPECTSKDLNKVKVYFYD